MNVYVDVPEPVEATVTITLTLDEARKLRALVGGLSVNKARELLETPGSSAMRAAFSGSADKLLRFTGELFREFQEDERTATPTPWDTKRSY